MRCTQIWLFQIDSRRIPRQPRFSIQIPSRLGVTTSTVSRVMRTCFFFTLRLAVLVHSPCVWCKVKHAKSTRSNQTAHLLVDGHYEHCCQSLKCARWRSANFKVCTQSSHPKWLLELPKRVIAVFGFADRAQRSYQRKCLGPHDHSSFSRSRLCQWLCGRCAGNTLRLGAGPISAPFG